MGRRASSLPRNPAKAPNLLTTSLTSSTIWKPDGKCPSFADILKGSLSQDIIESKSEVTHQSITTSTIEEDVKTDKKKYDDLPSTEQRIKSHRNTLPKVRKKVDPPPSETLFAYNSYEQTEKHVELVKVENVFKSKYKEEKKDASKQTATTPIVQINTQYD